MAEAIRNSFPAVSALSGFLLGWLPMIFHGPIPEKFDIYYINGSVLVLGFYLARCLIGLVAGVTVLPPQWYLRGPLCGALMMLPLGFVVLATPGCGGI
jgi:hypothetical protein